MTHNQEVERSIITTYRSKLWSKFIRALKEYKLIEENDKICVCISGGKDSFLMAKLFQELLKHSDFHFECEYLVMNPGYNEKNLNLIKENLADLEIPAKIVETNIFDVANMQESSPCYLCARMRRGALYRIAEELGCNKIALGHHYDDVIETTLMNMLNTGSIQTMLPKLLSDNYKGMQLIRPLYLIREKDILAWVNYNNLKFIACACKLTERSENDIEASKRKATKQLIKDLKAYNINVEKNIFSAPANINLNMVLGYKIEDKYNDFNSIFEEKKNKNLTEK